MTTPRRIFSVLLLTAVSALAVAAQGSDDRSIFARPNENDGGPTSLRETLYRLKVEESKKQYGEMLKRGEEAVKLAADLDRRLEENGRLTTAEYTKVAEVEKLVKKIRSELGGSDDDGEDDTDEAGQPSTTKDAVKRLRSAADALYENLKKTSRFTISATAIETTNAILRVARFLRVAN